jgi:prevent-host-death family protein
MKVNMTELQQHLPIYLERVRDGEEIQVTAQGKIIARVVPASPTVRKEEGMRRLIELRAKAFVGNVENSSGEIWDADQGVL